MNHSPTFLIDTKTKWKTEIPIFVLTFSYQAATGVDVNIETVNDYSNFLMVLAILSSNYNVMMTSFPTETVGTF